MTKDLTELQNNLGIRFNNITLLRTAFTHRSYINETNDLSQEHNERLEYLGDAVLELSVTRFLFDKFGDTPEGQLTAYRAALVRTETISQKALELGFNDYLLLSKGEARDIGRARNYILANTLEAFIGALYLDKGFDAADEFINKQICPLMDEVLEKNLWRDAKSYVQEKAQELMSITPTYDLVSHQGPDHDKVFVVAIKFGDETIATGEGPSKQEAQQEAARAALSKMKWH
jgi:ribonuclease III